MTLIVGYGNLARSDDGVGIRVAEAIAARKIPGVEVRTVQQLSVELIEELIQFEKVIFIDASEGGDPVFLREVKSGEGAPSSSHYLSPEVFQKLALDLYGKKISLLICTVRGENFEFGETLSPVVQERAREAVQMVESFVKKETQV